MWRLRWNACLECIQYNVSNCRMYTLSFTPALLTRRHIRPLHSQSLSALMNGPIRKKLGIIPQNVTWGGTVCRRWILCPFVLF